MGVLYIRNKTTGKFEAVKSLQGLPGKDGTMTFEDLTDEQRESLRGPEGKQGNTGERGETGATPVFSFEVETGAAGTPVAVEQSGTPENPIVKLTIPRGDTGAVEGVDYYEAAAMPLGQASSGTANGLSRGDHVHPMPSAEDIGALGKNGTAVNSSKLGDRNADEYLLKEEAIKNPVQSVTANNVKYMPDQNGNVNLGTIGGSDLGKGTVKSINNIQPDESGNVEVHMSDILPDQEDNVILPITVEDSEKLGGKAASEYATTEKLNEVMSEKLGKTEPAADSAKLNGEYAAAYLLAKSFEKFTYLQIDEPDTNIPVEDVPHVHWDKVPTGKIFVCYITRSGAIGTVLGFKASNLYGMYITLSYFAAPVYHKLYNGNWNIQPLLQDVSSYATKAYVSTAITEALNAIQNASGVSF